MKITVLDGNALNPGDLSYECFNQFGEVTIYPRTDSEEEAIARIGDSQIVLTNKVPITESLLTACPGVEYVGVQATGYNIVDCAAARRHNVTVTNVPSYGTAAVAQFTFALLLEICHRIGHHNSLVHSGVWEKCPSFCFWDTPQMELAGKTLGIIGYGRIGKAVGALGHAFGMHILVHSRSLSDSEAEYVDLDSLLARSDIISLHCPQTPQTECMICADTIAKMKDGAILINTSRGGLIDEAALAQALHSGKIRAAAVDVVTREPILGSNPLLQAPNCIITPHMAWAPVESRQRLLDCVVENIRAYLNGAPQNVIN